MASKKEVELSIILRAVDKVTAVVKSITAKVAAVTKPIRDFRDALGDLKKKSGLDDVVDGFKGVGSAVGDLLGKIAMIGGAIGLATAGLLSMIGGFDDLGDKAEALGVGVDFLAQMRYAAEQSGASVEQLDGGLKGFVSSLGQARAGTGRMAAFLKQTSPAFLKSLKGAKSNEEAFDLLADAMSKIQDPAKRAAFAQKTLGDASLAPLLARGADGVKSLRDRYLELAGSQEGAAAAAGQTDGALKDLHAATDGVKAALVEGLAPALTEIIKQIKSWLVGHRGDVKEWAAQLGKKLPAAFDALVGAVQGAIEFLKPFFDSSTKLKIALGVLAAVIAGPLISAVVSLGIAIMTTPVGWILAGIAALAIAVYEIYKHWDGIAAWFKGQWQQIKDVFGGAMAFIGNLFLNYTPLGLVIKHWKPIAEFFVGLWDEVKSEFQAAWDFIKKIVDEIVGEVETVIDAGKSVKNFFVGSGDGPDMFQAAQANLQAQASTPMNASSSATVKVDFANAPKGTRVAADPKSTAEVDLSVGYQMAGI